ncbi:MAG: hypothetical protein U0587_18445 [Candidatus Binatia bacterium]
MAGRSGSKRKTFVLDEVAVRRAKRALGAATDAEAVRLSVEHIAEMDAFWSFMRRSRGKLRPGTVEAF